MCLVPYLKFSDLLPETHLFFHLCPFVYDNSKDWPVPAKITTTFCGFPGNKPVPPDWFDICVCLIFVCWFYDRSTQRLTESGFMEKPGIQPAISGLQGIGLFPYTRAASWPVPVLAGCLCHKYQNVVYWPYCYISF